MQCKIYIHVISQDCCLYIMPSFALIPMFLVVFHILQIAYRIVFLTWKNSKQDGAAGSLWKKLSSTKELSKLAPVLHSASVSGQTLCALMWSEFINKVPINAAYIFSQKMGALKHSHSLQSADVFAPYIFNA